MAAIWVQLMSARLVKLIRTRLFNPIWYQIYALKVRVWNKIKKYFRWSGYFDLSDTKLPYLSHLQLINIRSDPFFWCCHNKNCVVFGKNPNYPIQLILIRYNLVGDGLFFGWWHIVDGSNNKMVIYTQLIVSLLLQLDWNTVSFKWKVPILWVKLAHP